MFNYIKVIRHDQQPLFTGSIFAVQFRNCIYYTRNYFVVYKINIHDFKCLGLVSVDKAVVASV